MAPNAAKGSVSTTITTNNAQQLSPAKDSYVEIENSATLNRSCFMPMSCGKVVVGSPNWRMLAGELNRQVDVICRQL